MRSFIQVLFAGLLSLGGCGREETSHFSTTRHSTPLVIISDIDDTIRLSGGHRLANKIATGFKTDEITFYRFANVYHALVNHRSQPAKVYYVTGAPKSPIYNLFHVVRNSVLNDGFPQGEFRGREVFEDLYEYKITAHSQIIEANPGADILLLGDDTSKDEAVFMKLEASFPDRRITRYIHLVRNDEQRAGDSPRYVAAPDFALRLYQENFISEEALRHILNMWLPGYQEPQIKKKRIFPKWLNCKGYPQELQKELNHSEKLVSVRDDFRDFMTILTQACSGKKSGILASER